jgi:menaquinol-cytochrome c reductase iron-sulfur subunit
MKETTFKNSQGIKRRGFMTGAIYMLASVMGGAFVASVSTYLLGSPQTEDSGWADAGDISDLQPGAPQQLSFSRSREDGWRLQNEKASAWVVIDDHMHVTAFSPRCTHLGCAYHWQANRKEFVCPCHGSVFSKNGDMVSGPANRPLDRYAVKVDAGRLWLGPAQQANNS